jgi:hypothetical protein
MSTFCLCGFDCSDFIAHHAIPLDAQFACPACDAGMRVKAEVRDAVPLPQGLPSAI